MSRCVVIRCVRSPTGVLMSKNYMAINSKGTRPQWSEDLDDARIFTTCGHAKVAMSYFKDLLEEEIYICDIAIRVVGKVDD